MASDGSAANPDARSTLHHLKRFVAEKPPLTIAVVASVPDDDDRPGEPATLSLAGTAERFFRNDVVAQAIASIESADRLLSLDPVFKPEPTDVEFASVSDIPELQLACDTYSNLAPAPEFAGDDAFIKRLTYYVVVLGAPGGQQAFLFRSFSQAKELGHKKGAAIFRRDGQYARVEDRIFLFDEAIDCLVYDDVVFVLRKGDYRRIFQQFSALRERAMDAARDLHQQIPIANLEDFVAACGTQAGIADKLLAVQKRPYYQDLTLAKLRPVIKEFDLDIEVRDDNGTEKLVFQPDPAHRWLIVKLLDDDYLNSSMTNLKYETNSKFQHSS